MRQWILRGADQTGIAPLGPTENPGNKRQGTALISSEPRTLRIAQWAIAGFLTGWAIALASVSAAEQTRLPVVIHVEQTYNQRPFDYRIESRAERPDYVAYRLTYPSPVVTSLPQNNTVPAAYYVPKNVKPGDPKRPAVICMHILDGNDELMRMTCSTLASHGIPAIAFKLPYYGERGTAEGPRAMLGDPKLLISSFTQCREDIRRTVDVLASLPEIDSRHLGIMGISLGGIVAATAAAEEPRLERAMLILSGGDQLAIVHHARETRELSALIQNLPANQRTELEQALAAVDPLHVASKLRPRAMAGKVLMVNAANDEVIPRVCTEKLAAELGISDKVHWLEGLGHYTSIAALEQVLDEMIAFFGQDLDPALRTQPVATTKRTPPEIVLGLVQEAIGFLLKEPGSGRCHFAELSVTVTLPGQKPYDGHLLLIRGASGRFKLQTHLPVVGDVAIGQGKFPWMVSADKRLFKGVQGLKSPPGDPLAFADPEAMTRIRVASGAVAGAMLAPEILDSMVTIADERTDTPKRTIRLALRDRRGLGAATARLVLKADGKTPESLNFSSPAATGNIQFLRWQTKTLAPEALFEPPVGMTEQEVEAVSLHRVFSAMFNFAVEAVQ